MSKYTIQRQLEKAERESLNKYSDLVAHLLFHRGILDNDTAEGFVDLDFEKGCHDPFLLKDMEIAVERILKAINEKEKITVFSDYDADGIPGAVVMNDFFVKIGYENFEIYIPHRNKEGFGLSKKALQKFKENGTGLVITLDCGISDVEQVKFANGIGLDVIVTDHHEPHEELPPAFAIINPKQKGCEYPEKMLCGSGVAFKLVQALIKKGNFENVPEGWEKWLLDMVGVATLSDMVPLVGENRIFAKYGMMVLKKSRRKGLLKLFSDLRLNQRTMTETDVVFSITPRINAASRMDEPKLAFKMLKTLDDAEANETMRHLHNINDERKGLVALMVKQIRSTLSKIHVNEKPTVVVAGNTNWRPSLLGLAATKILEDYNVPVFLWGRGEGSDLKGSCRSPKHVDLVEILSKVPKTVLETFGGHKNAGGFVVALTGVDLLENALAKAVKDLNIKNVEQVLEADYLMKLVDVNMETLKDLEKMRPFGMGNPMPVFVFPKVLIQNRRGFGKGQAHIEFEVTDETETQKAIMFYPPEDVKNLEVDTVVDLLATVEFDEYSKSPRLRIEQIFKV